MAPRTAPWIEPSPPTTTISSSWIDSRRLKASGEMKRILWASSAPASPVMPALNANAIVLYCTRLTPRLCAEISEVADGDHGAPRRRSREVDGGEHDQNEHGKTEIVELPWLGQREAEEVGGRHRHSLEAAGHRFPADDELLDDLREGQRGDGQVDARHAVGRHRHERCRPAMAASPAMGNADEERHALGDQIGVGVGADRHEGAVPQADEPREADQQHEPDAGDRQDENVGELADVEVAKHQRRHQQAGGEQRRTRKPARSCWNSRMSSR